MSKIFKKISNLICQPVFVGIITFLIALFITQTIAFKIYLLEKDQDLDKVKQESIRIKEQLESSLINSITSTKIISFLEERNLLTVHFDSVAAEIIADNKFIDALQLVEGTVITNTYPLKGNESVINYDILNHPASKSGIQKSQERLNLYFQGPFDLKQGGKGIVGRFPIIKNNEFWGFAAVILKATTLLNAAGIQSTGINETFLYDLIKVEDQINESSYFFHHEIDYLEGIYHKNFVPLGNWYLYVKYINPPHFYKALPFSIMGILFSMTLSIFVLYLTNEPTKLRNRVAVKTEELRLMNTSLKQYANKLKNSNNELEQFAYVASHDLQEPLRMVSSFLSLIEKKYSDKLDDKGLQYIHHAVDGAERMRQIILDLLDFSRIGQIDAAVFKVDLNKIIAEICSMQQNIIEQKNAQIKFNQLPVIIGSKVQFTQIFQNLINNALKYTREDITPEIHIGCEDLDEFWRFYVKDNGIGITPKNHEKIFIIFQRLHSKLEYEGTGMGLAIVKKIVEYYGGTIWLESEIGKGSTFFFTIKKQDNLTKIS